jgi:hypothetical protein
MEVSATECLFSTKHVIWVQRAGRDDVLVCPRTAAGPVYWVHLTWQVETDPTWPWTETYSDAADFVTRWHEEEGDVVDDTSGEAG